MPFAVLADAQPAALVALTTVQGVSTIVLGWMTWRISSRQARNAEYKTRLDLYDRRYAVWQMVMQETAKLTDLWDGRVEDVDLDRVEHEIRRSGWTASFLFKEPVRKAIQQVAVRAAVFVADYAFTFKANPHFADDTADVFKTKRHLHRADLAQQKLDLDQAMHVLADEMRPYLDFRNVADSPG